MGPEELREGGELLMLWLDEGGELRLMREGEALWRETGGV